MVNLIYCATPSRLNGETKRIMDYVSSAHHAPFHPLQAFEYQRFEGGVAGREKTLEFCCRAIDMCDEFWLFGISSGTMYELEYVLQWETQKSRYSKPIRLLHEIFDPEWQQFASTGYLGLIQKVRRSHSS